MIALLVCAAVLYIIVSYFVYLLYDQDEKWSLLDWCAVIFWLFMVVMIILEVMKTSTRIICWSVLWAFCLICGFAYGFHDIRWAFVVLGILNVGYETILYYLKRKNV